jgi:hypothetical protein
MWGQIDLSLDKTAGKYTEEIFLLCQERKEQNVELN